MVVVLQERKVLDHGTVQLLDMMPRTDMDMEPVRAARISFGEETKGEEADKKLLKYLIKHKHTSTLEHIVFKFRIDAPVVVWWQWVRHRLVSYNFQSGRYTEMADKFYIPSENEWRLQSKSNKQGSDGVIPSDEGRYLTDTLIFGMRRAVQLYEQALEMGVAKEQARLFLPAWCLYYPAYVTTNARSLINFLELRLDSHAQWEIRQYAATVAEICRIYMPLIMNEYFEEVE